MVGSIDPRCETLRGTHWPVKVAGLFGTRVAETILASGVTTAPTGRTYGCKRSDQTLKKLLWHGGRPHMGPGSEAGTTKEAYPRAARSFSFCALIDSRAEFQSASDQSRN
jgi:hypothetical protein